MTHSETGNAEKIERLTRKPSSAMVSDRLTKMEVTLNIVFLRHTPQDCLVSHYNRTFKYQWRA